MKSTGCVTFHEVIDALGRLPTQRSEFFVLDHLLARRQKHGSSVEKLYAGLLRAEFAARIARTDTRRVGG